jgi:hypothetical protein
VKGASRYSYAWSAVKYRPRRTVKDFRRAARTIAKSIEKCIEVDGGIFEHLLWTVAIYWDNLHNQ